MKKISFDKQEIEKFLLDRGGVLTIKNGDFVEG